MTDTPVEKESALPPWKKPSGSLPPTGLKLYNSLTRSKTEFVPEDGETVRWYTCGPTVYDEAHVGHARNYVQADIVRRVMEDYFRYNVVYVMNITDVDDKIIIKSHLEHLRLLIESVVAAVGPEGEKTPTSVQKALATAIQTANDPAMEKNMTVLHDTWKNLKDALVAAEVEFEFPLEPDFRRVAKKYEMEFIEDMRSLGVRDPSALTRVTEFIPHIVEFVEGIVKNGYAYVSNGSVYFDTVSFMKSHDYGKLQPESVGDVELFEEAEGSLSLDLGEKRCSNDFALWKKSKEGEPAWDSPWGIGRPGWHIECSTMSTHVLGKTLDIHSGGVDLRFPHHDNEIAQSEAFFNSEQWVNYFIHVGHLHIEGFKMSRSKKNFFSIREVLQTYTARQIRMFCLLRRFEAPVDYSKETMDAAVQLDKFFGNFFQNIKVFLRKNGDLSGDQLWKEKDFDLHKVFMARKVDIDLALKDSINTPVAVAALQDLVKAVNVYLTQENPLVPIIRDIAGYVSKMFRIFGFFDFDLWPAGDEVSESFETRVAPFLNVLASFRDQVRAAVRDKKDPKDILVLCDQLRDDLLPEIGVRLEDVSDGSVTWKLEDPKVLMMERQRAIDEAEERKQAKEDARRRAEEKRLEKIMKGKIHPRDMFRNDTSKYSQFDEEGLPTHDADGKPLSKGAQKKTKKAYDAQMKLHQSYLAEMGQSEE